MSRPRPISPSGACSRARPTTPSRSSISRRPDRVGRRQRRAHDPEVAPTGGTAWHYCREDTKPLDYLFIDEAGQIPPADALALATAARNVVLLGDTENSPRSPRGPTRTDRRYRCWSTCSATARRSPAVLRASSSSAPSGCTLGCRSLSSRS